MTKASKIKDWGSLEAWLLDRPEDEAKQFAVSIAHRWAMRVLPVYWHHASRFVTSNIDNEGQNVSAKCLHVLRAHLFCSIYGRINCSTIEQRARRLLEKSPLGSVYFMMDVAEKAGSPGDEISSDVDVMGASAIRVLSLAYGGAAKPIPDLSTIHGDITAWGMDRAADDVNETLRDIVISDFKELEAGHSLITRPLWPSETRVSELIVDGSWKSLKAGESLISPFWINWYQDALDGREPDWEMLHEIALIPDEDWQKGPAHINRLIAGIVEKYRLLREVQHLRRELAAVRQTTTAPIGHNNPPEGIDVEAEAEVVKQAEIIWVALGEAEAELSMPEPSPSKLKRAGQAILGAIKSALKYCTGLGDIALKSAAGEFGKWGGRALVAWFALRGPELEAFANWLIEFAKHWQP